MMWALLFFYRAPLVLPRFRRGLEVSRRGEAHPRAKLTASGVRLARALWRYEHLAIEDIRQRLRLSVTNETLRCAVIGETWKHLKGEP